MGRRCCVAGCTSTSRLPEHHGVTYHTFPLDRSIRAIWLRNSQLNSDKHITKSVLVCSRHFRRADFQPQRSGKFMLKPRVFPTVFPWGRIDAAQVEADLESLKSLVNSPTSLSNVNTSANVEEDKTKATVEAKVAQIMAETAELNARQVENSENASDSADQGSEMKTDEMSNAKFEPVTVFNPGARLEARDFNGVWHTARVVEVDNDDREVLIHFEKTCTKLKSSSTNTEEWIPMKSTRLRQKIARNIPIFTLEEKCMARWSGPRKFPGTVKKILENDTYEILFDDGYVKNVRAIHMSKLETSQGRAAIEATSTSSSPIPNSQKTNEASKLSTSQTGTSKSLKQNMQIKSPMKSPRKRYDGGDWKLLDLSKIDLKSLNLPEIPKDGEWTCHWVNDQPIGREGFLVVGDHRKPTVVVEDWRLPTGWIKHMYQRSNVLGKWDVILVSPKNKRFRSKADLKLYLEERGERYNPDIYDFSIHRRRAKDIGAYAFTYDYTPQQLPKSKFVPVPHVPVNSTTNPGIPSVTANLLTRKSEYMETPVAPPVPPMELMTSPIPKLSDQIDGDKRALKPESDSLSGTLTQITPEDGYAYIGGLKVQIVDNLFRCPQEGCLKNFRKENHLQIHVKHYHKSLAKILGECPKMMELAEKRTHPSQDLHETAPPKNQIPNQEFFAKLHQQDMQHIKSHRKLQSSSPNTSVSGTQLSTSTPLTGVVTDGTSTSFTSEHKQRLTTKKHSHSSMNVDKINASLISEQQNMTKLTVNNTSITDSSMMDQSVVSTIDDDQSFMGTPIVGDMSSEIKRSKLSPHKRVIGARKSNRQRTLRRYFTASRNNYVRFAPDNGTGLSDFEDSRLSFNVTPDSKSENRKRKSGMVSLHTSLTAPTTPLSSVDSPLTGDSGSSPFRPSSIDNTENLSQLQLAGTNQQDYIKENGEVIKIVRMRQEEIINCVCSYGEEDGLMIQCELCLCWQHGSCNGIDKESDVPEKYVCYICRNPQAVRGSLRYKHDQDWLYEGKLPVANYHNPNPILSKRFDYLKRTHILCGNLIELKQFMHSLCFKLNMSNNRSHPKLYLWAHNWEKEEDKIKKEKIKSEAGIDTKTEEIASNVPQPEAAINAEECQQRLLEHINNQQNIVEEILEDIERKIGGLENEDDLPDLKNVNDSTIKNTLALYIKEMETLKQIAKTNSITNTANANANESSVE